MWLGLASLRTIQSMRMTKLTQSLASILLVDDREALVYVLQAMLLYIKVEKDIHECAQKTE